MQFLRHLYYRIGVLPVLFVAAVAIFGMQQPRFLSLLNLTNIGIQSSYLLIVALAQIKIRRRLEKTEPERLKLKMWFFPWLSYFAVGCILAVLVAMALTPDLASQFYTSLGSLAVTLVAFALRKKFGAKVA